MRRLLRDLFSLLSRAQRRRWLALAPLLFGAGIIETVATGMVFGLIRIAGDPSYARRLRPVALLLDALPWHGDRVIVLGYSVLLALFFIVRGLTLLGIRHAVGRAEAYTVAALSTRLFDAYLGAPFALHLKHSPSELAHDATNAVERVVTDGLGGAVNVTAEVLVSAGLGAFLLIAAPVVTLVSSAVLAVLVYTSLRLTKRSGRRWGRVRHELSRGSAKQLHQSLGGVREIKVLGRERTFLTAFADAQRTIARTRVRHGTLLAAPRLAIETLFVLVVVLVVGLVTLRGSHSADVMPLLGVYAYAGFRLIPAANRLLMRLDSLRVAGPAAARVRRNLALFERETGAPPDEQPIAFTRAIAIENLGFRYDGTDTPVLHDVSFTIRRGQSIGVVGPTGAGKSTLIDILLGLLEPTSGRITIDGVDLAGAQRGWQRLIGYVPQAAFLFDDTIACNVALGVPPAEIDEDRLDRALRMAQLSELVASLPLGTATVIGDRGVRLSGGQRQRVAIARALYHQPELLVFDEATAALDNRTERELTRAIEGLRGEKTLIVVAHRLTTVQRCDALVFMRDGRVAAIGPYERLLADDPDFRAMAALADDDAR